jgi:hypothetical protein
VPSQFSAIGFTVSSGEDLAALASQVAERADTINAKAGQYLKWAPPESHALMAGQVIEAAERQNAVSGQSFWWALIDTVGGTFDVVIDPSLLSGQIRAGTTR